MCVHLVPLDSLRSSAPPYSCSFPHLAPPTMVTRSSAECIDCRLSQEYRSTSFIEVALKSEALMAWRRRFDRERW